MIERNLSLDYLKVFLSFCIVALHSGFLGGLSTLNGYLFVNGFFRIAVPIFFMINGYFLYKNINNKNYIKEVIKHIFFMYIIWMVLYFPLYYSSYNFGSIKGIISFVFMLFNGYAHLWYLVSMIVSIIFIYLIRNINENQKLVIAIVIYLLGCAIDYISFLYSSNSIFFKIISNNYFTRNFFFMAFPFMFFGYYIAYMKSRKIDYIKQNSILILLLILGVLSVFIEAYLSYIYIPKCSTRGKDFLFSLLFVVPVLFLYFINKPIVRVKSDYVVKLATAIYFSHIAIQYILKSYFNYSYGYLNFTLISIVITFAFSLLLIHMPKNIRKYIL